MENASFDFKKMIKQRIDDDIEPILKQEGFNLLPSCTFIREKNGLLQILYFGVQKTRLKSWAYFLPIYLPCIRLADYGTDGSNVHISLRRDNPYAGFNCIFISSKAERAKQYEEYITKTIPQFAELVSGIRNAVLPEMERISSLARFVECLKTDRFLWGNTLRLFPNDQDIIDIACQTGARRIKTLQAAAKELDALIPKPLLAIITGINAEDMSNQEADVWFEDYCNRVRDKLKLL